MAKFKKQLDQRYIEDELMQAQQDPAYMDEAPTATQSVSPERMSKRIPSRFQKNKSGS